MIIELPGWPNMGGQAKFQDSSDTSNFDFWLLKIKILFKGPKSFETNKNFEIFENYFRNLSIF